MPMLDRLFRSGDTERRGGRFERDPDRVDWEHEQRHVRGPDDTTHDGYAEHGYAEHDRVREEPVVHERHDHHHRARRAGMGAIAAGGAAPRRRKRKRGLLPLLLGLLLLLGLIALALALLGNGGDDKAKKDPASTPSQQQQQQPSQSAAGAGALQVGGESLQPGADLSGMVGQDARIEGAKVVQVDGDGGFWVGRSGDQRTFVEYGPAAGADEATQMPKVGDTVNLTGPVAEPPKQPGRTFGIPVSSEKVILKQGGYVNADRVTPAR